MADLDPRKQTILQAIIVEYVKGAEPVGSEQLVQRYALGVKSATVRNELAEMSELGYLEQPHTSAGRIPSDLGYRYYVDRLIVQQEPDERTKSNMRHAAEHGEALQTLLRETSRMLSRLTHLLSVAATYRDSHVTARTAVVSALGPQQALLVLVLSNGHVHNRMIECPAGLTLQDIGAANEALGAAVARKKLRTLIREKAPQTGINPSVDKFLAALWSSIRSTAKDLTRGGLITDGEEFMFAQPEFQRDVGSLTDLFDAVSQSDVLYGAVASPGEPQTVRIGRENRSEKLHQLSVVRQSFYVGEHEAGVIAVVGPTRMSYDTSIPLVNYTAQALTQSLSKFFG